MSSMKRMKLHHLREKIVQDLDVKHIVEHLLMKGALSMEDAQEIYSERARTDQTRHLLDILPKRNIELFDQFVESLKKDYDWLYQEFTDGSTGTDAIDDGTCCEAFLLGGVPHPPPYYVKRMKKLNEVRKSLKNLKRGNFVVLHGMTGCGKSCLAAAAVDNKSILTESFKGSVYWITLGECDEEELLGHMNQLLQRLELSCNIHQQIAFRFEKRTAKEELKRYFLQRSLRHGLLILDDVTSHEHIEAFDIGCKILVTTKDLHIMSKVKGRYNLIKMNEGFTESESLLLLAQSIGVPINQLPHQANVIHSLSQGSPIIMALIAGQLEENSNDAKCSRGRWEYYVNMFSQKNFGNVRRHSFLEQNGLFETISMSVNNLPFDKKKYYIYFALFMEDVNIKPEVLQTLWSIESRYEIEDIMAYFTKKSLAVCKWNEQSSSNVYGIHNLLLHYLKEQLTCEEKVDLHRKLLRNYHEKSKGDYSKLPNDNYIYSYLGYHIYHAEEWQLFQVLYFDLNFIQSKLRITGPADVLGDFKKYKEQIINENNNLAEKHRDFMQFIQTNGLVLYKDQNLDIIQCGLLARKESHVFKEAYKIAKATRQKLYFEFLSDQDLGSHPLTLPLKEIISACFTNEMHKILVADSKGIISLWTWDSLKLIKSFKGHTLKVSHIELHPDNQRFISCCEDGSLKLWSLDYCTTNECIELNRAGDNLRISTPQCLQANWESMFSDDSPKDESVKTYLKHENPVICAKFSHSGKEMVSCSKDSFIVWDVESSEALFSLQTNEDYLATCCTFSWNDSLMFFGGSNALINIYDYRTKEFVANFCNSSNIIAVLCIPNYNNKMIAVSSDEIRIWQWNNSVQGATIFDKQNNSVATFSVGDIAYHSFGKKRNCIYVSATSSNNGVFLVTISSDNVISVWNLGDKKLIAEHKNNSGFARHVCLDTCVEDRIPLLLCGSDDQTVKIWRLDQSDTVSTVTLLPYFDTIWKMKDEWLPFLTTVDTQNRIQVLHGNEYFAESPIEAEEVLVCAISQSGSAVYYGCADGKVKKFDVTSAISEVVMKFNAKVIYLQYLQNYEISLLAAGDGISLKILSQDGRVLVCYGQDGLVVQSFLLPNNFQLLSCNEDASVKLWDINTGKLSKVIIGRSKKSCITSVDLTEPSNVLVLTNTDSFLVASLVVHSDFPYVNISSLITKQVHQDNNMAIRCCKISPQGQILALGLHSGSVLIWNLRTLEQIRKFECYSSPVNCMLFASYHNLNYLSEHSVVLVTVGEKIAWWDTTNLIAECKPISDENFSTVSSREHLWETLSQNQHPEESIKNSVKQEKENKTLHLGCVKLIGSHALKISCSPDYLCYLTVDTSGIPYLLKLLC